MTGPAGRNRRFVPPAHGFAPYLEAQRKLDANVPNWVRALRTRGMEEFQKLGFPTTRVEDWKYTDTSVIAREAFTLREPLAADAILAEQSARMLPGTAVLCFVHGRALEATPSGQRLPSGSRFLSLRQAWVQEERLVQDALGTCATEHDASFTALNLAFLEDGAFLWIPPVADLATPVQLLFAGGGVTQPTLVSPRNVVVVGERANVTLVEWWYGESAVPYLTNAVTEIVLAPGARIDHIRITSEQGAMLHMARTAVRQSAGSSYTSRVLTFGGRWARVETETRLAEEGSQAVFDGLYIAANTSLVDHHTTIDHVARNTTSRELYKGILDGASRGVFNGKVYVRPKAFKSDAQQMNKNLLLSDDAEIDTKPQLEIFADDVKCSHGAAIGRLDEDALFYLRARGIGADEARRLLIFAFANEIVERLPIPEWQPRIRALVRAHVAGSPEEDAS